MRSLVITSLDIIGEEIVCLGEWSNKSDKRYSWVWKLKYYLITFGK
tara:strand:+ start:15 stop:152 length:138 start_codon:yes stop_codon:yes gene_type:complete